MKTDGREHRTGDLDVFEEVQCQSVRTRSIWQLLTLTGAILGEVMISSDGGMLYLTIRQ